MKRGGLVALGVVVLVVVATVAQPALELIRSAFEGDAAGRFTTIVTDSANLRALWNSLWISVATVALGALVGLPLALLIAPLGRVGDLLHGLALTPLLLSPVLGTISFHFLFGTGGVLSRWLPAGSLDFQGPPAVLAVHALTLYVYFFLFTTAALRRIDPALAAAARTLGASRARAFFTVTWPMLRPALSAAAILTFMASMASFTAPYVFGGGERYLTTAIFVARKDDPSLASALSLLLAVISVGASALIRFSPDHAVTTTKGTSSRQERLGTLERFSRTTGAALLVLVVVLPVAVLVLISFKPYGRIGTEGVFDGLGLAHYRALVEPLFSGHASGTAAELMPAIGRSAIFATIATVIDVAVALAIVLLRPVGPRWLRSAIESLAMLPVAVPGTVIAIALLGAFASHGPLGIGSGLIGSVAILPLAYFVRHLPVQLRATISGVAQLDRNLPDAARTLGAGAWRTIRTITLPLLAPSIMAGAVMGLVTGMGEFVASILLYTPATEPASVAIYGEFSTGSFGIAAAAGVLLSAAAALAVIATRLATRRAVVG